jgi:ATP-dependent Clp protease ATP-binding subunit ClpC
LLAGVEAGLEAFGRHPPASFVLLGEPGTGKSALFQTLAARLIEQGWTIFECSARDLIAGQVFIGQLEQRMRELLANLDVRRRVIWYVPSLHELYYAGRHQFNPMGALDLVLPAIESGSICVVGETEPAALEKIVQQRPRVRTAFKSLRVEPLDDAETFALAARVVAEEYAPKGLTVDPALLREALEMSRHYLGSRAQPGSLIALLRAAAARAMVAAAGPMQLSREHLIDTVSQLTGLPRHVLDDREGLDPHALRALFSKRVMGQAEAVDCLVDRIAMLKAGLTDPHRPIGVFLFAGPTGTGKTEVAKTLAEFLFGSIARMIRLDMSEFQEPSSLARIIGEQGERIESSALANRIRQQPFAVVLLDEFEKAHPRVWDLFLQVFDDARLTDAQGNIADFRYSIIILTTNLGATEHRGSSLGFTDSASGFTASQIVRVIGQTFRPEFVNRLDRVVVFRPLSKAVMRDILRKELANVLQRRGFRDREWAVEWEESAIDFLLEKGFTPDMGARPLRRAIEQHLLAPIAMTMVEHRFPEGDQFLFVRSDGRAIQVEFVDPDAPVPEPAAETARRDSVRLPSLVLSPAGGEAAIGLLERELAAFEAQLAGPRWSEAKRDWFDRMNEEGFWRRSDRFEVLGRIELTDRIEAGLGAARSLLKRVSSRAQRNAPAPRALIESLAQQLYLLHAAERDLTETGTSDAYLSVEAVAVESHSSEQAERWARQLVSMYHEWARKRQVRTQVLGESGPIAIALSGLGAHQILKRETGLHVFETPDASGGFKRSSARVRIVPQPFTPRSAQQSELQHALASLSAAPASSVIVRRYREQPSPLVRDAVAGWRSGRLDQILGGDFDLMSEQGAED